MSDQQPKRAAIYARVSTVAQEDGYSLQTQEEGCRRYAPVHGYVVDEAHVYHDVESGRLLYERPALLALLAAIHRHAIDVVIIHDLDRLMRDQDFLAMLHGEANYAGVEIEFVIAPRFEKTPEGTLMRNITAYLSEKEHEKIRERTMRGRRARAAAGKLLPGHKPLYGCQWNADRTAYLPLEEEAAIVRRIFARAAQGVSMRRIARDLTAEGIPTPSGGQTWRVSSVHALLTHPFYGGQAAAFRMQNYVHKIANRLTGAPQTVYSSRARDPVDQIPYPPSVVPPLVDASLAETVLARFALNKAQAPRNNHNPEDTLLRGGFARCGYCGNNLIVTHVRGTSYECKQNGLGSHLSIAAHMLDAAAWAAMQQVILDPTIIAREVEKRQEAPPKVDFAGLEKQLKKIRRQQATLARQLSLLSQKASTPVRAELERLAAQESTLEQQRDEQRKALEQWKESQGYVHSITAWCQAVAQELDTFTYADKRNALLAFRFEAHVYRKDHRPRYEMEMHLKKGDGQFRRMLLSANEEDCVQVPLMT